MLDRRIWRQFDWLLFVAVVALLAIGIVMIYSATQRDPVIRGLWLDQAFTAVGAVFLLLLLAAFDYALLRNFTPFLYLLTIGMLILVLVVGQESFGARRWFRLPGFDLQPGEVTKVLLTVVLARFIADREGRRPYLETIVLSGLLVLPCVGLIMLQPNLSTALTIVFLWLAVIFVGGLAREHILLMGGAAVALLLAFLIVSRLPVETVPTNDQAAAAASGRPTPTSAAPGITATPAPPTQGLIRSYQLKRIENLLFGGQQGENYQSDQALIALGSGGMLGKGLLKGTQTQYGYFPVRHTDFIFSVIGEELGFVGATICLLLLFTVILRALWAAYIARDNFGRLLCVGVAAVLFLQTYINVGMQVGWAPVTGVVLPFISYGRTNLIVVMVAVGIVESVVLRHRRSPFAA
ncbi:MAG: FtsW/RodA/SpoVE family cell cycle protein [Chloroflexi bacterium]|nr:FtsW/RodA/SpoVE family cell cycle protein [Chloroflexota bacterium]